MDWFIVVMILFLIATLFVAIKERGIIKERAKKADRKNFLFLAIVYLAIAIFDVFLKSTIRSNAIIFTIGALVCFVIYLKKK